MCYDARCRIEAGFFLAVFSLALPTLLLIAIGLSRRLRAREWALGAMLVQICAYVITSKLLHMSKDQIEANNTAFGTLLGAISLSIGAINAACIS